MMRLFLFDCAVDLYSIHIPIRATFRPIIILWIDKTLLNRRILFKYWSRWGGEEQCCEHKNLNSTSVHLLSKFKRQQKRVLYVDFCSSIQICFSFHTNYLRAGCSLWTQIKLKNMIVNKPRKSSAKWNRSRSIIIIHWGSDIGLKPSRLVI